MIKLLHTADVHLDAPFPSLGEKEELRRSDFIRTFEKLLNLAIKNEVDFFLVAGDLFDSPTPSTQTVGKVQAGIKRLTDRGIVPVIIPGTHDHVSLAGSVYRRHEFPGAIIMDSPSVQAPVVVEIKNQKVCFYGFAFSTVDSGDPLPGLARQFTEGIHIGLLHGSRKGSPEWSYRKKDLVFTLDDLKNWRLDYVALGHYHDFEVLGENGRVYACYPGSPEGKRFGENGLRHAALVTIAEGEVKIDRLAVNTRTLREETLDLSGVADHETVRNAVLAQGDPDTLLRLTLKGTLESPIDFELLYAQVGDNFFHLELVDQTSLFDSHFALRIAGEETVRGCFVRRVQNLMAGAATEEKKLLEKAFREVLVRFKANGRDPT